MARILVVDNSRPRLVQVGLRISGAGHDVQYASDNPTAIESIVADGPELVFVIWPDLSAKLIKEIRRLPVSIDRPKIILTIDAAKPDKRPDLALMAQRRGATGLLLLPCDQRDIHAAINLALIPKAPDLTVDLRQRALADPGPLANVLERDPIVTIGNLAGGMDVLDRIIERSGARRDASTQYQLAEAIIGWGSLRTSDQIVEARRLLVGPANSLDPVSEALRLLARQIVDRDDAGELDPLLASGSDPIGRPS